MRLASVVVLRSACAGVALLTLAFPGTASACPVCFGTGDRAMVTGSAMGVGVLLVITLGMLLACGAFALHLARRARWPVAVPPVVVVAAVSPVPTGAQAQEPSC